MSLQTLQSSDSAAGARAKFQARFTPGDVDAILCCFTAQQIQPKPLPLFYRMAIVLVAVAMVLLPVLYVGIIVATGWLEFWYAEHGSLFLESGDARAVLIYYFGPLFAGALLAVFLFKPFFSRAPKPKDPMFITREQQPAIWALVEKLCAIVRAPVPKTIALDCSANASASFEPGLFAFISGRLRLTIGMPLVTGLTLEQLTGVLAHEFGHFAQGGGIRLSATIRWVNAWFARVVYDRDGFDRFINTMLNTRIGVVMAPAAFTAILVWIARRSLWLLMNTGRMLSANLMRQMEFDADSYETRIAGSAVFAATMRRVVQMGAANDHAWNIANESFKNGKLAEDIPMLAANCAVGLPVRTRAMIESNFAQEKGGMFDSHPVPQARCVAANTLADAGIFSAPFPATMLFRDGAQLSREVTRHHYIVFNGIESDKLALVSNKEIEQHDRLRVLNDDTLETAFGGLCIFEIPTVLGELSDAQSDGRAVASADAAVCAQRLRVASEKMKAAVATSRAAFATLKKADDANMAQAVAATLMFIDCKGAARQVPGATRLGSSRSANKEVIVRGDTLKAARDELASCGALVAELLHATASMRLVSAPDDAARREILHRWAILKTIRKYSETWLRLRENAACLAAGLNAFSTSDEPSEALAGLAGIASVHELARALDVFQTLECPFSEAEKGSTMRGYLTTYHSADVHELVNRHRSMQHFVSRLDEAHTRIAGWMTRDESENEAIKRAAQIKPIVWPS